MWHDSLVSWHTRRSYASVISRVMSRSYVGVMGGWYVGVMGGWYVGVMDGWYVGVMGGWYVGVMTGWYVGVMDGWYEWCDMTDRYYHTLWWYDSLLHIEWVIAQVLSHTRMSCDMAHSSYDSLLPWDDSLLPWHDSLLYPFSCARWPTFHWLAMCLLCMRWYECIVVWCVCACVWERKRECVRVCVCVCVWARETEIERGTERQSEREGNEVILGSG